MRAIRIEKGLKLLVYATNIPQPRFGEVLIKVHNASILNIDTLLWAGSPAGYEASGEVVGSGGGSEADNLLHKRVARLVRIGVSGAWAEYVVAPAEECVELWDNISYSDAATMTNAMTLGVAMHLIRPRKRVVLSVPLSGLGRLASTWFRLADMHCIRVVHKQEHMQKLANETHEPVLLSSSPDFDAELEAICRENQVNAAFEMVGGEVCNRIFNALQPDAFHVQMGFMEGWNVPTSEPHKHAEIMILLDWMRAHPSDSQYVIREVQSILPSLTHSDPLRIFPVSNCESAFQFYLSQRSFTRVQIEFS